MWKNAEVMNRKKRKEKNVTVLSTTAHNKRSELKKIEYLNMGQLPLPNPKKRRLARHYYPCRKAICTITLWSCSVNVLCYHVVWISCILLEWMAMSYCLLILLQLTRAYFSFLEVLFNSHINFLLNLDATTFMHIVGSLESGLKGLDINISSQVCILLWIVCFTCLFFVRAVYLIFQAVWTQRVAPV